MNLYTYKSQKRHTFILFKMSTKIKNLIGSNMSHDKISASHKTPKKPIIFHVIDNY